MSQSEGKPKRRRYELWILGLLIALVCGLLIDYGTSYRSGVEFCPQTFAMRSFDYKKMSITGWIARGIHYQDHDNFVGNTILADKWITAPPERQWDLVSENSSWNGSFTNDQCDARFFVNALQKVVFDKTAKANKNVWIIWSEKHPNCAKEFWPIAAEMARQQMYLALPDFMKFAKGLADEKNVDKFKADLEIAAVEALVRFAKADEATGNKSRALGRYKLAANINGNSLASLARDRLIAEGILEPTPAPPPENQPSDSDTTKDSSLSDSPGKP